MPTVDDRVVLAEGTVAVVVFQILFGILGIKALRHKAGQTVGIADHQLPQRAAALESACTDPADACGDSRRVQIFAAVEGKLSDFGHTRGDRHRGKIPAGVEGIFRNCLKPFGEADLPQGFAPLEGVAPETGHAVGDLCNAQIPTVTEGKVSDGGHPVGEFHHGNEVVETAPGGADPTVIIRHIAAAHNGQHAGSLFKAPEQIVALRAAFTGGSRLILGQKDGKFCGSVRGSKMPQPVVVGLLARQIAPERKVPTFSAVVVGAERGAVCVHQLHIGINVSEGAETIFAVGLGHKGKPDVRLPLFKRHIEHGIRYQRNGIEGLFGQQDGAAGIVRGIREALHLVVIGAPLVENGGKAEVPAFSPVIILAEIVAVFVHKYDIDVGVSGRGEAIESGVLRDIAEPNGVLRLIERQIQLHIRLQFEQFDLSAGQHDREGRAGAGLMVVPDLEIIRAIRVEKR